MVATFIGTSGYNYPEWRGSFYPEKFPTSKMFGYYAERFTTVEINYSFYRLPSESTIQSWAAESPPGFRYTLKAPRRITHDQRLRECQPLVESFCGRAALLGDKLAVLLFQLPPNLRLDLDRFDRFLEWLPAGVPAAFEFRNASWLCEDVYTRLRARNLALCVTDAEDSTTPVVATAGYGYFRLRDEGYSEAGLQAWAERIGAAAAGWDETFIYFKHEEAGKGPEFAATMKQLMGL
jgi:uncharacterized protein YecE (DUF72 family)